MPDHVCRALLGTSDDGRHIRRRHSRDGRDRAALRLAFLIFQYLVGELLKSKQRGEKLHRIATTDELTGLANRERFRARLDERIAAAERLATRRSA